MSADVSTGNLTNATAIGNGAVVNASNKIRLGNTPSASSKVRSLTHSPPTLKIVVLMAMHTGFRNKELKTIVWSNIDVVRAFATVINAYSKNGETGTIPLSSDLVVALRPDTAKGGISAETD